MATIKIRDRYWVDIGFRGKRYRKRSPHNSEAAAKTYEATLRQKLARGEPLDDKAAATPKSETFEKFAWRWMKVYVAPNNKYSEQKAKRSVLNCSLLPFFGKMSIEKITKQDIEQFKAASIQAGFAPKTVNNRLAVFNKCLATAYEWLKLSGTPPKAILLNCPPAPTRFLSPDECEILLAKATGTLRDMTLLGLRTGMRQGELIGIQWSSINWENRTLSVRHSQCYYSKSLVSPKNNRVRTIPMDADVYEMLFRQKKATGYIFTKNGIPIGCRGLLTHLKKAAKELDLGNIGWHTLRHTFASHLAMQGAPLPVLQALMGHSSITTTMRYAHVAPSALRSAIEMLSPKTAVNFGLRQPDDNTFSRQQSESFKTQSQ